MAKSVNEASASSHERALLVSSEEWEVQWGQSKGPRSSATNRQTVKKGEYPKIAKEPNATKTSRYEEDKEDKE